MIAEIMEKTKKELIDELHRINDICEQQKKVIESYTKASKCQNCGEVYYRDYGIDLIVQLDLYKDMFNILADFCNTNILHAIRTIPKTDTELREYIEELREKIKHVETMLVSYFATEEKLCNGKWAYIVKNNNIILDYLGQKEKVKNGYLLNINFNEKQHL